MDQPSEPPTPPKAPPSTSAQITAALAGFIRGRPDPAPVSESLPIQNARFAKQLDRLRDLREFLLAEAIPVEDDAVHNLPALYSLNISDVNGRAPLPEEWAMLEGTSSRLFGYLKTEDIRRKFLLGQTPGLISTLPVILLVVGVVALVIAIFPMILGYWLPNSLENRNMIIRFVCYLFWIACLGGIGAIAFISVNTLSIQTTATFDINNKKLIMVRVILGALFGVVLSIAFSFPAFLDFCNRMADSNPDAREARAFLGEDGLTNSLLLIMPFITGFSTTLVIMVLNRLVESVGIFFGGGSSPSKPPGG